MSVTTSKRNRATRPTWCLLLATLAASPALAHHPEKECAPVRERIDVIGPLGNRLPPSYRRTYNRPRDFFGRIAYYIAPSSQEAMVWHDAKHRGDYECDRGRVVNHYFYKKPYEALMIGDRRSVKPDDQRGPAPNLQDDIRELDRELPEIVEPPAGGLELPRDQYGEFLNEATGS